MTRKLYRSSTNKVFAGVCGGFGEYLEIDPVLVRIITVVLTLGTGFGLLAYIVAWIVMPKRAEGEVPPAEHQYASWHKYLPGLILIGIGAVLLVREYWYWLDAGELWAILLIIVGLGLIFFRGANAGRDSINNETAQPVNGNDINGQPPGGNV